MTDITNTNLEAALIDQKVAGEFRGKTYAFVSVLMDAGWHLGVAVANEKGFSPLVGKKFESQGEAKVWADSLNRHIGLTPDQAINLVSSTMFPNASYDPKRWLNG